MCNSKCIFAVLNSNFTVKQKFVDFVSTEARFSAPNAAREMEARCAVSKIPFKMYYFKPATIARIWNALPDNSPYRFSIIR